jgi:hypothetical protein
MRSLLNLFTAPVAALVPVVTLALALASGSANAVLVVEIDDPDVEGTDFRCVDGDPCDLADLEAGFIRFLFEDGTTAVIGTATSKPVLGNDSVPALILNIEAVETTEDSLDLRATESGFTVLATTDNVAAAIEILFEVTGTLSIEYLADPANGEFTGNTIANIVELLPALSETRLTTGNAPALAPGSLSINASLVDTGLGTIEGRFSAAVDLTGGLAPPFMVPDVVGLSEAEAEAELEAEGLRVGAIIEQENCAVPPRTVLDQDPDAGTNLPAGSPVDLTVAVCTAAAPAAHSVPTLSQWAMILMMALLAIVGGWRVWRRS